MSHTSDDNDNLAKPSELRELFRSFTGLVAAVLGATRSYLNKIDVEHASRCNRASFSAEEFQDTGIDPSDATGIASWQPALPFFMQSGFGRN